MSQPDIHEIARQAGVSIATVSRVINNSPRVREATRKRVLSVMKKLNYRPNPSAQNLGRATVRSIGVVTHPDPDLDAHYFAETLRGIREGLNGFSYDLLINPQEATNAYLLLAPAQDDPLLKRLEEKRLPTVLINATSPRFSSVDMDNTAAAYEVVRHLLRLGHRRVAIINGKMETSNGKDRFEGYRKALKAHKVPFSIRLVERGNFSEGGGHAAMKRLLALKGRRPTAVFAANDHMAMGALRAIQEAGLKAPQHMALAGFDDIELAAKCRPPLTTVRQPLKKMGYEATRFLLDMLSKGVPPAPRRLLLEGKLMIRKSCGAYASHLPH